MLGWIPVILPVHCRNMGGSSPSLWEELYNTGETLSFFSTQHLIFLPCGQDFLSHYHCNFFIDSRMCFAVDIAPLYLLTR